MTSRSALVIIAGFEDIDVFDFISIVGGPPTILLYAKLAKVKFPISPLHRGCL